jgi:hypothetical protein
MPDREAELQARTRGVRFLLYPVIFSSDLAVEADRVCRLFQDYPLSQILDVVQDVRAELEGPAIQVSQVERLVSNPAEHEVRAYLKAVVTGLEATRLSRGGA